jgi:sulfur carrier protein
MALDAKPPYAVAVNLQFVPKSQHAEYVLQDNDSVEIISPVTGG